MVIKKKPEEIFTEYERCVSYNNSIDLYDTVERNENFYNDKQWEGVSAPDLDKPVFNFLKPVVNYYISTLVSDEVACSVDLNDEGDENVPKIIEKELERVCERENLKYKNRRIIRNCAVDGDACLYFYFEPKEMGGYYYGGDIKAEVIGNTDILFCDPCESDIQKQPYIIIAYRRLLEDARDEARENGLDARLITADDAGYYASAENDAEQSYVTVLLKLWKEKGSVHIMKTTRNAVVKKEADTGYRLYPAAYMSWESGFNSYHGVSPLTGKIPNQTFVNKLYAMAMEYTKKMAFPKLLYDRTKLPEGWNNKIGAAVAVTGNPSEAFFSNFMSADMSGQVMALINATISQSKEMMGAYDAALGNIDPKNTSAIVATQKAAAAPLDIQRLEFYNFTESCMRIMIEMMRVNYGIRSVVLDAENGERTEEVFDFSRLDTGGASLKIDIGRGNYWSEITQIATLDNMMLQGILPSASVYLENLPDGYIKGKQKLVAQLKQLEAQAAQAAQAANGMQGGEAINE